MKDTPLSEVRFDLRTPCADCPFRRGVPAHQGVAKALPEYASQIEMATFAHTCHKTDPRSDGFKPTYTGPVQHCAGALIMCEKSGLTQVGPAEAWREGRYDPTKLDLAADVYTFPELVRFYLRFLRGLRKRQPSVTP